MVVDLSVLLNEQTPVYPGDANPKFEHAGTIEENKMQDHILHINNHLGTHIDAPFHMFHEGKTLDQFPIDTFVGRGVLIDIRDGYSLEKVEEAGINQGDIVFFFTGMDINDESFFNNYQAMHDEVVKYLIDKKVRIVGVNAGGVDHEPFPVHKAFLENDILIIEDLVNLEPLLGKEFTVYALPLRLQLDGSPARVIAQIEE